MQGRKLLGLIVTAAALLTLAPEAASAANLYASPTGSAMDDCTNSMAPCSLERAVNTVSVSGDDITLLPGTYTTSTPLGGGGAFNRTIHGAPGARPTINFTAASTGETGIFLRGGSVIRDVVIESTAGNGGSALFLDGATGERISVHETGAHASGSETHACTLNPETVMRDSVCWYSGAGGSTTNANAIFAQSLFPGGTATLRNVTAIAANAPAIRVIAAFNTNGPSVMDLTATNVIARGGGTAGEEDVMTTVTGGALSATATLDHSNYATESENASGDITDPGSGTNVTTAPAFVNAGTGDFHQLGTSAGTLNLGTATGQDPLERDIDNEERTMGSAPDIGADELAEEPPAPIMTGTDPPSGSNENNPLLIGTAAPFSVVHVFASSDCSATEAGSDTAEVFASPGIGVSVPDNSSTTFSANAVNEAGTSDCSGPLTYAEVTPPPMTPSVVAPQPLPSPAPAAKKKCKKKKHRAAAAKKCKKKKK